MRHPFLRTLAGSAATPTDPNFENVTLLLHGDGTNGGQNNTFVDGSTNNFTITRNGNTTQGTFSPYGDNWSNYFDGTGDYLTAPDNAAFAFGTGDFTVEYWLYPVSFSNGPTIVDTRQNTTSTGGFSDYFGTTGSYNLFIGNTTIYTSASNVSLNSWTHIAVSRSGTSLRVFLNGSQSGSTITNSTNFGNQKCFIGINVNLTSAITGYLSNVRLVKGSAVYTANFTPSTAPLTAITNTSLLTCQSNRFRDASTNNFTITRNGDVSVQRFSPFSPTAAYAAGTIGGSGYFDGTGDNLLISSATGLCDFAAGQAFTFQLWFYRLGSTEMVFISGGTNTFQMGVTSGASGGVRYGKNNVADVFFGAGSVRIGTWTHIALCRNTSNTTRCWINGVSVASTTSDTYAYSLAATYIGSQPAGTNTTNGFLSDMRILKGQALYDPTSSANIDVPTAPLTAITNTSFLLNFTNAAILDNAMMAVPETVGNAQISTSVKKYGTGSLYFDGTGDYLSIPPTSEFEFGTGDFTVECWFYASTVSGGEIPVYKQHGGVDAICEIRISSSKIYGKTATDQTVGAGTTTLSTNTWYHVAFVKSSNVYSLYLNGVSEGGTVTNATRINRPTTVRVGSNQTAVFFFTGYIDDLRVTKGVARYTANFTPPTAAFPDL